jgi:D-serine deaminase-like pyridoxal phosphate-dependent protein
LSNQELLDLTTPAALVDLDRLERNISEMATRAREGGVSLRPHIKTHKCIEIGEKQVRAGAQGITVSTLAEASAFAKAGFTDITYAVPLASDKFEGVRKLSEITHLNVLVDHPTVARNLGLFCKENQLELDVLVKIDCGLPRCGIDPSSPAAIDLVREIAVHPLLNFKGILTHAGHSYEAKTVAEIKTIAKHEQDVMVRFSQTLKEEDARMTPEVVSIGSTPTARLADTFHESITEIRPGNYVFFDYTQVALGSCDVTDCALTVLSSVISMNENRVIIDAGATALSKDLGPRHIDPNAGYGKIIQDYNAGHLDNVSIIESLSQEHGKIRTTGKRDLGFSHGSKVRILPNHSCLTANLFDHYYVVRGGSVVQRWEVHRGRFD